MLITVEHAQVLAAPVGRASWFYSMGDRIMTSPTFLGGLDPYLISGMWLLEDRSVYIMGLIWQ